ncbi:hypothetical protein NM208_g10170 [Fusarium decemcellulare]|uniref:Uncharacterized protein n=1 Tax=Fusarium decemcellulare TaxID=57161 RepID=A0ACC1RYU1_9HYPO|nr:hypothetical protein NM208_g10170 [Fusarium decemcellulare]
MSESRADEEPRRLAKAGEHSPVPAQHVDPRKFSTSMGSRRPFTTLSGCRLARRGWDEDALAMPTHAQNAPRMDRATEPAGQRRGSWRGTGYPKQTDDVEHLTNGTQGMIKRTGRVESGPLIIEALAGFDELKPLEKRHRDSMASYFSRSLGAARKAGTPHRTTDRTVEETMRNVGAEPLEIIASLLDQDEPRLRGLQRVSLIKGCCCSGGHFNLATATASNQGAKVTRLSGPDG